MYAFAGAAILETLRLPQTLDQYETQLKASTKDVSDEMLVVKQRVEDVSWLVVSSIPAYKNIDKLVDELDELKTWAGQKELNLAKSINNELKEFWSYVEKLIGPSEELQKLVQTSSQLLEATVPLSDYRKRSAIRIILPIISDLVAAVRARIFESVNLVNVHYFVAATTLRGSEDRDIKYNINKTAWFTHFSYDTIAHMRDAEDFGQIEKSVSAFAIKFADQITQLHSLVVEKGIDKNAEMQQSFPFKEYADPFGDSIDQSFTITMERLPWVADVLKSSMSARGYWLGHLFQIHPMMFELTKDLLEQQKELADKKLKGTNMLIELLAVADKLGFEKEAGLGKELLKLYGDYAAGLDLDTNLNVAEKMAHLSAQYASTGVIIDQNSVDEVYIHFYGDVDVTKHVDHVNLLSTHIEYKVLRAFYEKVGMLDSSLIGNDIEKLAKKTKKLEERFNITTRVILELLGKEWDITQSQDVFNLYVLDMKDIIIAKLGKLDEDEFLFSQDVIDIMTRATLKITTQRDISVDLQEAIIKNIIAEHELVKTQEEIEALQKQEKERNIEDEIIKAGGSNVRYVTELATMGVVAGGVVTFFYLYGDYLVGLIPELSNWDPAAWVPRNTPLIGKWSPHDYFSPEVWLETITSAFLGSWWERGLASAALVSAGTTVYSAGKVAKGIYTWAWHRLATYTVPIAEKVYYGDKIVYRDAIERQKKLYRKHEIKTQEMIKEKVIKKLEHNTLKAKQTLMEIGKQGVAASFDYAMSGGDLGYVAIKQGMRLANMYSLPNDQQRAIMDRTGATAPRNNASMMQVYNNAIQQKTNEEIRKQNQVLLLKQAEKEEEEEEEQVIQRKTYWQGDAKVEEI
jgi:hypothetical protein